MFNYVVIGFSLLLTQEFHQHWQNRSKQETNGKQVIKVMRVIEKSCYYHGFNES